MLADLVRGAARRQRYATRHAPAYWRESRSLPRERRGGLGRLRDILRGYHPFEADWYRQIHGHCEGFVSNFDREERLRAVNGADGYAVDNKLILAQVLEACGLPSPRTFGVRTVGDWVWGEGAREALDRTLDDEGRFVIKPIKGKKGGGFRVCRSLDALGEPTQEAVMATAFVQQADYAQRIFAGSLNTLRVLMLRDEDGSAFVAAATHRFGRSSSAPVDNFSAGGVVARVCLDTGVLDRAARVEPGNRLTFSDRHPETDAPIAGVTVDHWPEAVALVSKLGRALPLLRYVGWDIAITASGPVVIEGNSHPSLRFFQFYGSVTADDRSRRFFEAYLPYLKRAS